PAVVPSGVSVDFCTDQAQIVHSKLKYIIVLDHSGSNALNYQMDPNTGDPVLLNGSLNIQASFATDPSKTLRYGDINTPDSLLNFLHTMPQNDPTNPMVYFSLFNFSGNWQAYPNASGGGNSTSIGGFDSDIRDFETFVTNDKKNSGDQG